MQGIQDERHTQVIGVDLAWSPRNLTGLAAAEVTPDAVDVKVTTTARTLREIVAFVREHGGESFTVAIDAPTVVPAGDRMRECERLLHLDERIRRAHAAPYPGTRSRLGQYNGGQPRGEELVQRLGSALGVTEVGCPPAFHTGRHAMEVFPAAAMVRLFDLSGPLPYKRKKGRTWEQCRSGLTSYIERLMKLQSPSLNLLPDLVVTDQRGVAFKELEDRVDAVNCAYVAALAWLGQAEELGQIERGYIVVPVRPR